MKQMEDAPGAQCLRVEDRIFAGGGVMGTLMRAYAWTGSPFGAVDGWTPTLRTVIRLCLTSHFPTVIFWGPELRMLYNDAYLPMLADKHPASLGQPARDVWPEIWSIIGPMLESVLTIGEATWSEDLLLPLLHKGRQDPHYFTFSYSPIQDETGRVCGVFCPVTETTERIVNERRLRESEARLQTALAAAQMGTWDLDLAHDRALRSPRHDEIFGYRTPQPEWGEAIALRHIVPEDQETFRESFRRARDQGELRLEVRIRWPDRSLHWISALGRTEYDRQGTPVRMAGVVMDITDRKRAEETLRENEARFRALANTSPGMVWTAAPDGTIIYANDQWLQFCGLTPDENRQAWPQLVLHPDDQERCLTQWMRALREGTPYEIEVRNRRCDGEYRWLLTRALPVRNAAGHITAWYGTTVDIHERKRMETALRASEERYQLALRATQDAIWDWDILQDRTTWSEALTVITGYPISEFNTLDGFNAQWRARVHPDDRDALYDSLAAALAGTEDYWAMEYRFLHADGHWLTLCDRGYIVRDDTTGTALRMVGSVQDITARKAAEGARERILTELQRINAEFQQFSYTVSHDLNEPLRTISMYVHLLEQRVKGKLDAEAEEDMAFVIDAARRMQQMLSDLLAYTRAGQTPEFRPVDCEMVLAQILTALEAQIAERGAVVTHDLLPTVRGDATRLSQVLQNLISNALKFCEAKPPRIHIRAVKDVEHWRFTVSDNGIGIDPRQYKRLFQVFQRLHTRSEYPGAGIGLAICKRIVEQHGGRIWVESRPGEGSTFYFTIRE